MRTTFIERYLIEKRQDLKRQHKLMKRVFANQGRMLRLASNLPEFTRSPNLISIISRDCDRTSEQLESIELELKGVKLTLDLAATIDRVDRDIELRIRNNE